MSSEPKNIKKFDDFKPVKRSWKMMNKLYIKGTLKGNFWTPKNDFELLVVYTTFKNLIVDIQLIDGDTSLRDKRFNIDFNIGDHIDKTRDWVVKNGHRIDIEMIK